MKLANISLAKKVSASKVNFLNHMKYYLAFVIAIVVSAIFVVSFLGFRADFDFTGGTVVTVVASGTNKNEKFNETCEKIENILKENGVEASSYQYEETGFGDAVVVKILNKNTEKNDAIKSALITEFGYDSEDLVEKNYVKTIVVDATATYGVEMASVALAVAIVIVSILAIFRYDLTSALCYLISVLFDIFVLISMIIICRIPLNASISSAFILLFVFSTLLKLLFFRRASENLKNENYKDKNRVEIANLTLREIFSPLVIISIIAVIALVLLSGLGTMPIRAFAIPSLIAVILSALTTFYFTPFMWEKLNFKRKKIRKNNK